MAIQIFSETFSAHRRFSFDSEADLREMALKELNEFFIKHDSVDAINIIENWDRERNSLQLTVYYRTYI